MAMSGGDGRAVATVTRRGSKLSHFQGGAQVLAYPKFLTVCSGGPNISKGELNLETEAHQIDKLELFGG